MLENIFVSRDLAIKLDKVGFDEKCFGIYILSPGYLDVEERVVNISQNIFLFQEEKWKDRVKKVIGGNIVLAPTYEQALNFITKKYNIEIWVGVRENDCTREVQYVACGRKIPFEKKKGFIIDCIEYSPKNSKREAYEFAINFVLKSSK